jgi:hypothetical protein
MTSRDNQKGINSIDRNPQTLRVQYASTKKFAGSKPSDFYDEGYFLRGEGSNYGRKDENGVELFVPYQEQYYLPENRKLAAYIARMYKPKTAIVLGCARAFLVKAFHELGIDCKGVDISEWAIKHAPANIEEHLYVGDICDLSSLESNHFDVTVALDVLEHIAVPDLFTALNEASRITHDALIINVPVNSDDSHPDETRGGDKSHVSVYSNAWWHGQFEERQFRLDGQVTKNFQDGSTSSTFVFRRQSALPAYHYAPNISSSEKPLVNIVMLNWNGIKFIPKCLDTLYKNTDYQFNLIVVDNKSTDASADYLKYAQDCHPNMQVVFNEKINSGYAQGINNGLKYIKNLPNKEPSPYVLLLNNDMLFLHKDWLSNMVQTL